MVRQLYPRLRGNLINKEFALGNQRKRMLKKNSRCEEKNFNLSSENFKQLSIQNANKTQNKDPLFDYKLFGGQVSQFAIGISFFVHFPHHVSEPRRGK